MDKHHDRIPDLPMPAYYFPIKNGKYTVKPGLQRLKPEEHQRNRDNLLFQLDNQFPQYRREKDRSRQENLEKYYPLHSFAHTGQVSEFIIRQLCHEHPNLFVLKGGPEKPELHCKFTQDILYLDKDYNLLRAENPHPTSPPYRDILDALACQVQEDFTLLSIESGSEKVEILHLCFPNHWSAEEKIRQGFKVTHQPVADFEQVDRNAETIIDLMINQGPYVRFAWGISTDQRLNHHPVAPINTNERDWQGRDFDPLKPQAYLRVERQVIWGLPEIQSCLFTIRTYFHDLAKIRKNSKQNLLLVNALNSMSAASLEYKGLASYYKNLLQWLQMG